MTGCASETVVDLELVQVVEVAFSQMEGDTQYQAVVALQDLRAEADYVELQPSLRCVGLDPYASNISIVRLLAPALETFLVFQVDIAPHGSDVWTPLAGFEGFVADHEVVPFSDGDFVTYYDGLEVLDEHALGDQPSFDLRVTGEVPAAIDDLVLDLTLELDFSTDAGRCPGPAPVSG
jgi:hypothetical protein